MLTRQLLDGHHSRDGVADKDESVALVVQTQPDIVRLVVAP